MAEGTWQGSVEQLLRDYGVPASAIINIISQTELLKDVDKDVRDLLGGYAQLQDSLSKPDFLKKLCEHGCTKDARAMMEAVWKKCSATDFVESLDRCIHKADFEKTQAALRAQADSLLQKKACELADSCSWLQGIKICAYVGQCYQLSQQLSVNSEVVRLIMGDLQRMRDRHLPPLLAMLSGGIKMASKELQTATEDFEYILARLQSARDVAAGVRRSAAMNALSSVLDLMSTCHVARLWSSLDSGRQMWLLARGGAQGACALAAGHVAYQAHAQCGQLDLIIVQVQGHLENIAQARRMIDVALGGA